MDERERRRRNDELEERLRDQYRRLSDATRSALGPPSPSDPPSGEGRPDESAGAGSEALVGPHLDDLDAVVALHDRPVPGTGLVIDHLVVAPSGVWVIRARQAPGRVRRRRDATLHASGKDRTGHVEVLGHQRDAVAAAIRDVPDLAATVGVVGVLCLIDAQWPVRSKPLRFGDVVVTWPQAMLRELQAEGPLSVHEVTGLADHLHHRFPPG